MIKVKAGLNYSFEPDELMFGMCEEFEGSLDKGADPFTTIDLIAKLGAKSMRIWMHHKRLMKRKDGTENEIEWRPDVFSRYRKYVEALTKNGVRIIGMNHNYLYPASFEGNHDSVSEVPAPCSEAYYQQMQMLAKAYEMMAKEFPEIEYWECGNESNMNHYVAKPGYSKQSISNSEYVPEFCYNNMEKAEITADLCYYSNLGIKKGNKKAFTVFPAPTPYRGYAELAEFYKFTYEAIKSGRFPRGLKPDTDTDNYFQVQSYHAYNFGGDSQIITKGAEMIYRIFNEYGDGGKKVFITEFGYHDSDFVKNRNMTKDEADKKQASFFKTDFEAFKNAGFIETVFVFRLYDWLIGPGIEVDFGLFTSPASEKGIVPKAKGLEVFRLFNSGNTDTSGLYKYKK